MTIGDVPPRMSGAKAEVVDHYLYLFGGHTRNGNANETYCLDLRNWMWSLVPIENNSEVFSPRDKFTSWTFGQRYYY